MIKEYSFAMYCAVRGNDFKAEPRYKNNALFYKNGGNLNDHKTNPLFAIKMII